MAYPCPSSSGPLTEENVLPPPDLHSTATTATTTTPLAYPAASRTRPGSASSHLGNLSCLSGSNPFDQFNFDFDNVCRAPRSPSRRHSSVPQQQQQQLAAVRNSQHYTLTPAVQNSLEQQHHLLTPAPRPVPTATEDLTEALTEHEEPPPPYTRFAAHPSGQGQAPYSCSGPSNSWRIPRGFGLFSTCSVPTQQGRMNMLTLDDLNLGQRSDRGARQKLRETRRGRWFCRGPAPPEKRGMAKTRKWCLVGGLAVIALAAAIVGGVMGTRARARAEPLGSADAMLLPDGLPLGSVVVRPFRGAGRLSNCTGQPYQWSCLLPPDTAFPMTSAINDNFLVPEFRFTIKRGGGNGETGDLQIPFPRVVPNDTNYENVAAVDEVQDAGVVTNFLISLNTTSGLRPPPTDGSGIIREESHMLPAVLTNQPLRIFDRGLDSEHYGFHIYFPKTIQFPNDTLLSLSQDTGGVSAQESSFRVQWNSTRFKVKIFTKTTGRDVQRTAITEMKLPVDIWEDRVGSDPNARSVVGYNLDKGTRNQTAVPENIRVGTKKRGCFCHWSNYRDV